MSKKNEALKMALEWDKRRKYIMPYVVRDAIREALEEQPAQADGDTIVQTFTGLPKRKLRELLSGGWEVNGVCFQRIETDGTVRRGAATTGGMVLWWNTEQPAQQEPVAYMSQNNDFYIPDDIVCVSKSKILTPLYTRPQAREPEQRELCPSCRSGSIYACTCTTKPAQQEPDYKALYEKAAQQYNELAALMAEKSARHIAYVCPQCHWTLEQPAQQEPVATESVLIDGAAYTVAAPVACEMLRLHLEIKAAPVQHEQMAAAKKDAVFEAAIEFVGTLTGMKPPPIETAPPEIFKPFRDFTEKVCSIFAAPQPAQQEPVGEIGKIVMFGGQIKEVAWKNGKIPPAGSVLYTSPPAQRKPLTHKQRVDLLAKFEAHKHEWHAPAILIDMVEAAHGIKENA